MVFVARSENLVWLDMEMTGLDPEVDRILEVATIVTDSDLNIIAEGPVIAVHQDDALLAGMDAWNSQHHNDSGLIKRVKESNITETEAEQQTLDFLRQHVEERRSPLCGNSISQDRRFTVRFMPKLDSYFHYRNLDVSTVKELIRRWRPDLFPGIEKHGNHKALEDVKDSIDELRYYRDHFFNITQP